MQKCVADLYVAAFAEGAGSRLPTIDLLGDIHTAVEAAEDQEAKSVFFPVNTLLDILEYLRVTKVGDPTGSYACIEWPGFQIPQTLLAAVHLLPVLCPFSEDDGTLSYRELYLYEKNPATKGLDFGDYPEEKEPFLRYSASFQLQNRVEELQRYSLPSLHDLSDGIKHELRLYERRGTHAQRGLVRLLRSVSALEEWVPPHGTVFITTFC
jgi:hypothetical protein